MGLHQIENLPIAKETQTIAETDNRMAESFASYLSGRDLYLDEPKRLNAKE